jgi:Icc-related predicted phosphoesterase
MKNASYKINIFCNFIIFHKNFSNSVKRNKYKEIIMYFLKFLQLNNKRECKKTEKVVTNFHYPPIQ